MDVPGSGRRARGDDPGHRRSCEPDGVPRVRFFFFSSRRRHTRLTCDWSSDECSSDLINPLIVTPDGELRALDSKYTVDDNALYKNPDIAAMRDLEALDAQERMARERGVTYVKLDGTVRSEERRVGKGGRSRRSLEHGE